MKLPFQQGWLEMAACASYYPHTNYKPATNLRLGQDLDFVLCCLFLGSPVASTGSSKNQLEENGLIFCTNLFSKNVSLNHEIIISAESFRNLEPTLICKKRLNRGWLGGSREYSFTSASRSIHFALNASADSSVFSLPTSHI